MDKFKMYGTNFNTYIGILTIDNESKMSFKFSESFELNDVPGFLYEELKQGRREVGDIPCRKLFEWLIMPPNRVNVEEELEKLDLKEYDLVEIIKRTKIDFPLPIKLEKIS